MWLLSCRPTASRLGRVFFLFLFIFKKFRIFYLFFFIYKYTYSFFHGVLVEWLVGWLVQWQWQYRFRTQVATAAAPQRLSDLLNFATHPKLRHERIGQVQKNKRKANIYDICKFLYCFCSFKLFLFCSVLSPVRFSPVHGCIGSSINN
jgi:hypothetical protein